MRLRRTFFVAVAVPTILLTVGTNIAGAAGAQGAAKGTIKCTSFTGTVTFKPPLVPGTATTTKEKETSSNSTLGSCVTTPSGGPASASGVKEKPTKLPSNACSALESTSSTGASFTIAWPGISASKVTFTGASQTSTGYSLSGGTVKGSYATTNATATIVIAPASITAISNCISGKGGAITSISITGGSMNL
jgi:hypothetical protein